MNVGRMGWEARYRGPLLSTEVDLGQPPVPSLILESAGPASCPPTSRPRSVNHSFDKVRRSWRVVTSSGCPSDCMRFPLCHVGRAPAGAPPLSSFHAGLPLAFTQIPRVTRTSMQPAKSLGGRLVPQWTPRTNPDHVKDPRLARSLPRSPWRQQVRPPSFP